MNKKQRTIGWIFAILIGVVLIFSEACVLGLAVIGVWWFVAAGNKRRSESEWPEQGLNTRAYHWTEGMMDAIRDSHIAIQDMLEEDRFKSAQALAVEMADTWGEKWIEQWARSQRIPYDELLRRGRNSVHLDARDEVVLRAVFAAAAAKLIYEGP